MMSDVQSKQTTIAPVTKSVTVALSLEDAFKLFTADISTWWPLPRHSVFDADAASCHLEGKVGGRLYEVHKDHRQADWGKVLVWEPPHRLSFIWHPGYEPQLATEVEVMFQTEANGTRVTLVHRNWERLGERASKTRESYNTGWEYVLAQYTDRAMASG